MEFAELHQESWGDHDLSERTQLVGGTMND